MSAIDTASQSIERFEPGPLFSEAVAQGGILYLSGQIAIDHAGQAFDAQLGEVLSRIDALVTLGGARRDRLLTALIHLPSSDLLPALNAAWEAWLPAGAAPVRTTVIAGLVSPRFLVEVTVTAAILDDAAGKVHRDRADAGASA